MAEVYGNEPQYRTIRQRGFKGVVDNLEPTLIDDGESPYAKNIDFDKASLASTFGSRKFNNQTAPNCGILTKADPSCPPLYIDSLKAVPVRGYGYIPYQDSYDIGGDASFEGTFPTSDSYHQRRGKSFEIGGSFMLPSDEKLFEAETRGSSAPAIGSEDAQFSPPQGYDEALDDCFLILQKGGDRTAMMSWAIGVVNVGKNYSGDGSGTSLPPYRPSNYALCFMWYDAPQWGEISPPSMMYNLTSGALPTAGSACSQALRSIVFYKFIEPGKRYSFTLGLDIDSGSPGALASNTSWNYDGSLSLHVREEGGDLETYRATDASTGATGTGFMEVWKGPQDSLTYLIRYGVRFFGRDAMFAGLGYRFHPWREGGFIPYGSDSSSLVNGGFRMVDRSATTIATLYPTTAYTLTAAHTIGNSYVSINHGGFTDTDGIGTNLCSGVDPMATYSGSYLKWLGQGNSAGTITPFNSEALRGYRLVTTGDWTAGTPDARGMVMTIQSYARNGALDFRCTVLNAAALGTWAAAPVLVQAFRWNQRPLVLSDFSIWSTPRDYDSNTVEASRRRLSIGRSLRVDDQTEPDISSLLAYWPFDDGGGGVLREKVIGGSRNGFLCPMGMGVTDGGDRGKEQLFLSGEGEALCLDLSENPVLRREMEAMLQGDSQGFAVEVTCTFTEAFYGLSNGGETSYYAPVGGSTIVGSRPKFVPEIATWDLKNAETTGATARPRPLLSLSTRCFYHDVSNDKFQRPMAFGVDVAAYSDQNDLDPIQHADTMPWYKDGAGNQQHRFSLDAPWVGKKVTMQVGIQSTGTVDQYDVYLAMSPKDSFNPASGDAGDVEFTHWSAGGGSYDATVTPYFTTAHLTIKKKDLFRSVVTIGGGFSPRGLGYSELNARMLIDEVRVFATSGPGSLSPTTGAVVANRDGKLDGAKALPPRRLEASDLLLPLGNGTDAVSVTTASPTVTAPGSTRFYTGEPEASLNAVKETFLYLSGEEERIPSDETVFSMVPTMHRIVDVAATGQTLTLQQDYMGPTRSRVKASLLRVIGYSDMSGVIPDRFLSLGASSGYLPGSSTSADIVMTEQVLPNLAPTGAVWKMRVFPLSASIADTLPSWTRGLVSPRRGKVGEGVLGITAVNGDVYAATKGCVYKADDRWRQDGPSDSLNKSLAFLAETGAEGLEFAKQADRIEFKEVSGLVPEADLNDAIVTQYDAWAYFDEFNCYQTILWLGNSNTDPALSAGLGSRSNIVTLIIRLNRGRPELVIGSSAYYTGTTQPEKGLFIASGSTFLQRGKWTHLRWYLSTRANGTILQAPHLKVNGREIPVTLNAKDNDASITQVTDWLRVSTIPMPNGGYKAAYVGVSRDSYKSPELSGVLGVGGMQLRPQRVHGLMHALGGKIAEVAVSRGSTWTGTSPPDFDPFTLTYTAPRFHILGATAEGVGSKVKDNGQGVYGTIKSHPFISVYHELGNSTDPVSFARFGTQLYVTNGSRPAVIINDVGRPAGVLPPTSSPTFSLSRFQLWTENYRNKTSTNDKTNGPIDGAASGVTPRIYHYRGDGNSYLRAVLGSATDAPLAKWGQLDMYGFKCYFRPESVAGRINLWRRGESTKTGGPFVEIRDGRLYVGWYDINLKDEVWVKTDKAVITPGDHYMLYVRMQWPPQDSLEGNWQNSWHTNGRLRSMTVTAVVGTFVAGEVISGGGFSGRVVKAYAKQTPANTQVLEYVRISAAEFNATGITGGTSGATGTTPATANIFRPMHNSIVLRRMCKTDKTTATISLIEKKADFPGWSTAGAPTNPTQALGGPSRVCVSLTTSYGQTANTTMTGQVTWPGALYSGTAAGHITTGTSTSDVFHEDMVGMYFQFGSGPVAQKIYKIASWNSLNDITVSDPDTGAAPNLAAVVDQVGGVFCGVGLVKSSNFDQSKAPYNVPTISDDVVQMFGSSMDLDPNSGFVPFRGDFYCPAYSKATLTANGEGARVFENLDTTRATGGATFDPIFVGTDSYAIDIFNGLGGQIGEAHADDNKLLWGADLRKYDNTGGGVSSQPNLISTGLTVTKDTSPGCTMSSSADPFFRYVQDPAVWRQKNYVSVAFYDAEQGAVSNPGPTLTLSPATEDTLNPSGAVQVKLSNLPASRDPGVSLVRVFKSISSTNPDGTLLTAGTSAVQRQVAEVPNGTSDVVVQTQENLVNAEPLLETDNGVPPDCKVLTVSQGRLVFGNLTSLGQADGVQYSKSYAPVQVPALNFFRTNTGAGDAITGLAELDGNMVVLVREGVFNILFDPTNAPEVKIISSGAGCVAHQSVLAIDKKLFWYGDRGIYSFLRGDGNFALGQAYWMSERLKRFFATQVDRMSAFRASAAVNRPRQQYVLALRKTGEPLTSARVATTGDVFSLYEEPNVTCLASVQPDDGGPPRLVGGTEEGFVVWLDDPSTSLNLMDQNGADGDSTLVASTSSTTSSLALSSGSLDSVLEGARGAKVRWQVNGEDLSATVLGVESGVLHFDAPASSAPSGTVTIGAQEHVWEGKWFDFGNLEKRKRLYSLDIEFAPGGTGYIDVLVYTDRDDTKLAKQVLSLPVSGTKLHVPLQASSNWFKPVVRSSKLKAGGRWEITGLSWRITETDQR